MLDKNPRISQDKGKSCVHYRGKVQNLQIPDSGLSTLDSRLQTRDGRLQTVMENYIHNYLFYYIHGG